MPPSAASGSAAAIVVAAGRGTRFGAANKVLTELGGRPVLAFSLDTLERAPSIDAVIIVAGLHTLSAIEALVAENGWSKVKAIVLGGERRQDSVAAGLQAAGDATIVAVHDGARPFASEALFDRCVASAREHGAAIAATPVTDTIKRVAGGLIEATVPRDQLWAAQTPQAVRADLLRTAFAQADQRQLTVTDEAGLLEALGYPVAIVESNATNIKVTRPEDIAIASALLSAGLIEGFPR